jgi:hypothetical protein
MRVSDSNNSDNKQESRAVLSSYIVLGWPYILATMIWVLSYIKRPSTDAIYASLLCIAVSLLCGTWLRGFRLSITDGYLEYRDGFYRTTRSRYIW